MKHEDPPNYWDSISRLYTTGKPQKLWRAHSDWVNIALLQDWLKGRQFDQILKTDLFDEAVSDGLYPCLQVHGNSVSGVDISKKALMAAKNRYPAMIVTCADVRDLPYRDDRFDLVVSNSTLDHFDVEDGIEAGLGELYRILRSGGELLVSLDNLQNPIIRLRSLLPFALLNRLHLVPYFVGKTLGRHELVRALNEAGFKVLETRAILHCPRVLAVHLAGLLERKASAKTQQRFLSMLQKFERMSTWPSQYFTGHFVMARAIKL